MIFLGNNMSNPEPEWSTLMRQIEINRSIRRAYRQKLLPLVEQCLLGRGVQVAIHYNRHQLDQQSAAEILACMEGPGNWTNALTQLGLMLVWDEWRMDKRPAEVSIGNFCQYLYDLQVERDDQAFEAAVFDEAVQPKPSRSEQQERRLSLLAMLYAGGYMEKFEPEMLVC